MWEMPSFPYLNDIDFFSAIIPDLKFLVITFDIFSNSHRAHLFKERVIKEPLDVTYILPSQLMFVCFLRLAL